MPFQCAYMLHLQEKDDSGLIFASGSHRDFALPFWHQSAMESMDLAKRGYKLCPTGIQIISMFLLVP